MFSFKVLMGLTPGRAALEVEKIEERVAMLAANIDQAKADRIAALHELRGEISAFTGVADRLHGVNR